MIIQIDSREKARAIKRIIKEFDRQGVKHPVSKLMVGDYMNYDNPRLIVDRKRNLSELCGNITSSRKEHERFRRELIKAQENEIQMVILVEHGKWVKRLEDVIWWENPRRWKRCRNPETGLWEDVETKATKGEALYKMLKTMERKYGCRFEFCDKKDTGRRIIEILNGEPYDAGGD